MKLFDTVRMKAALLVLKEDVRLRDERIRQLEAEVERWKAIAAEALKNADRAIETAAVINAQRNGGRR